MDRMLQDWDQQSKGRRFAFYEITAKVNLFGGYGVKKKHSKVPIAGSKGLRKSSGKKND